MMTAKDRRVVALALTSRLLVLSLMFLSDAAFPDLSSSAHLQAFPCDKDAAACGVGDRGGSATLLDDMSPWDSVYFVRIAKCGYETDMIHAFFPLLPLAMRWGERLTGKSSHPQLLQVLPRNATCRGQAHFSFVL
jgi:GPI mannosyltransferase 2